MPRQFDYNNRPNTRSKTDKKTRIFTARTQARATERAAGNYPMQPLKSSSSSSSSISVTSPIIRRRGMQSSSSSSSLELFRRPIASGMPSALRTKPSTSSHTNPAFNKPVTTKTPLLSDSAIALSSSENEIFSRDVIRRRKINRNYQSINTAANHVNNEYRSKLNSHKSFIYRMDQAKRRVGYYTHYRNVNIRHYFRQAINRIGVRISDLKLRTRFTKKATTSLRNVTILATGIGIIATIIGIIIEKVGQKKLVDEARAELDKFNAEMKASQAKHDNEVQYIPRDFTPNIRPGYLI